MIGLLRQKFGDYPVTLRVKVIGERQAYGRRDLLVEVIGAKDGEGQVWVAADRVQEEER